MPTRDQIVAQAKQVFTQFDTDANGLLDKNETREFYKVAVQANGAEFSEDHFVAAFSKFDVNGDGAINLDELTNWLLTKAQELGKLEWRRSISRMSLSLLS